MNWKPEWLQSVDCVHTPRKDACTSCARAHIQREVVLPHGGLTAVPYNAAARLKGYCVRWGFFWS